MEDRGACQGGQGPSSGRGTPRRVPKPQERGPKWRGGGRLWLHRLGGGSGWGRGLRVWGVVPREGRATGHSGRDVNTETVGINHKSPYPHGPLGVSQPQRG